MKKLFWGFFLIYLNFNLTVNGHALNVLPDFVGYILLLRGAEELREESVRFQSVRPFAVIMAVYTALLWVGALLGVGTGEGLVSSLLSLAATAMSLFVAWLLVGGVREMELTGQRELNGTVLQGYWLALAVVQLVSFLLSTMANLTNLSVLFGAMVVLIIAGLVVIALFLVAWWKCAGLYEAPLGEACAAAEPAEEDHAEALQTEESAAEETPDPEE